MFKQSSFTIRGVSPLIVHNGQLADPMNPIVKDIKRLTGKRDKTEADQEEIARLEWYGGLYLHNFAPCIPGEVLEATFGSAAKKKRKGQQVKAGLYCDGFFPIEYNGPRVPDELWQQEDFRLTCGVRVQRARVMRTRPIFRDWAVSFTVTFNDSLLNPADITDLLAYAGENVGLCEWRPKFGRFTVEAA